jgi:hypothetical protein
MHRGRWRRQRRQAGSEQQAERQPGDQRAEGVEPRKRPPPRAQILGHQTGRQHQSDPAHRDIEVEPANAVDQQTAEDRNLIEPLVAAVCRRCPWSSSGHSLPASSLCTTRLQIHAAGGEHVPRAGWRRSLGLRSKAEALPHDVCVGAAVAPTTRRRIRSLRREEL